MESCRRAVILSESGSACLLFSFGVSRTVRLANFAPTNTATVAEGAKLKVTDQLHLLGHGSEMI